ncbi:hypothetical protein STRIP9103_04176 [Streptomyces ipomoeae 91-03]|uniref:DUF952 domain-containing protein n=2 Tax=Streptomyces ipomoeae TaxID=103232 RepID=L1KJS6_9ACTN|nr:hypothetical protein STRIP9103_04176 [Streptomyces ipomoeae 91-03]
MRSPTRFAGRLANQERSEGDVTRWHKTHTKSYVTAVVRHHRAPLLYNRAMIHHVVTPDAWESGPDEPYAPASLPEDGFVHCSPDETTTLAVINAFYREAPKPLRVLLIDEERLDARVEFEAAAPAPPPGVGDDVLFPHVFGPINRDAVVRIQEVEWDGEGLATGLTDPK